MSWKVAKDGTYLFKEGVEKPGRGAGVPTGAYGYELDTDKNYIFDGEAWVEKPDITGLLVAIKNELKELDIDIDLQSIEDRLDVMTKFYVNFREKDHTRDIPIYLYKNEGMTDPAYPDQAMTDPGGSVEIEMRKNEYWYEIIPGGWYKTLTGNLLLHNDKIVNFELELGEYGQDGVSAYHDLAISNDGQHITAVISNGENPIHVSNDGGETFETRGSSADRHGVAMSADGKYQLTGDNNGGKIQVSSDYGQTWSEAGEEAAALTWRGPSISKDGKYQLIGNLGMDMPDWEPTPCKSSDYGQTWEVFADKSVPATAMSADGKYQVASQTETGNSEFRGGIYYSDDYGDTFTAIEEVFDEEEAADSLYVSDDGDTIVAISNRGIIKKSEDAGSNWNQIHDFEEGVSYSSISRDGQVMAVILDTEDRDVLISEDEGDSWLEAIGNPLPEGYRWSGVDVSANGEYITVANNLYNQNVAKIFIRRPGI